MKTARAFFLMTAVSAAAIAYGHDASACGGCFQSEATQVTGHRMILSISSDETTLWDQIEYSGAPESFAWVLPIKGQVNVGVSSDALFQVLEQITQVTVRSPFLGCLQSSGTGNCGGCAGASGTGSGDGVTIIDQQVVGPYETVQLAAQDPNALKDWLTQHAYNIPASIEPVIDAYVNEGFGFLALKLVPGQGVSSMKPVRVTTPGASPVLPLRMVAAGTGAFTAVQLWIFGEGPYEPANFSSFTINPDTIVWDWDTSSSNYSKLVDDAFNQSQGLAWLVDFAQPHYAGMIYQYLQYDGLEQYEDDMGMNAQANLDADMQALYGHLASNNTWITHTVAKLSQAALETDLQVEASENQNGVYSVLTAGLTTGTPPCSDDDGSGGDGADGDGSCECGVAGGGPKGALETLALGLAAVLVMNRRRRRAR